MKKIIPITILAILSLNYMATTLYSSQVNTFEEVTIDPTTEDFIRDSKKKYIEEVQPKEHTKRYVGDAKEDNTENSKRRGLEKRYIGDEEDPEVFFKKEEKALYGEEHIEKEHLD